MSDHQTRKIAIVGTVGVPGNYGGFETLADNLAKYHSTEMGDHKLAIYCSTQAFSEHPQKYFNSELRYLNIGANGVQSIIYDIVSIFDSMRRGDDRILLLGVSGALILPLVRLLSRTRVITNIDGIEWKREKWSPFARMFLRISEKLAVKWSHVVLTDNLAIAEYVSEAHGRDCQVIAYGGDHSVEANPVSIPELDLPDSYDLALCRIEPENNVAMIIEAYAKLDTRSLVFVGNWNNSSYGLNLRSKFSSVPNINLVDPIYDPHHLRWLRDGAKAYIHGHSAGGTNPSLVEMMHFKIPVYAYGCNFNRNTTENKCSYFSTAEDLASDLHNSMPSDEDKNASAMQEIARRVYTWNQIGRSYFKVLN